MSQVNLKMKRVGLQRQMDIEKRQAEIDEIERRKNLKNGFGDDDSRLGLREGTGMEEFQERVNKREEIYEKRADKIKEHMEKKKEKMFEYQKELEQRVVKDKYQKGSKDAGKKKEKVDKLSKVNAKDKLDNINKSKDGGNGQNKDGGNGQNQDGIKVKIKIRQENQKDQASDAQKVGANQDKQEGFKIEKNQLNGQSKVKVKRISKVDAKKIKKIGSNMVSGDQKVGIDSNAMIENKPEFLGVAVNRKLKLRKNNQMIDIFKKKEK